MRYPSPPLIKRSLLFSSTTLHMIDVLQTQGSTLLSCGASHSHSDSIKVYITDNAGQFGDLTFVSVRVVTAFERELLWVVLCS